MVAGTNGDSVSDVARLRAAFRQAAGITEEEERPLEPEKVALEEVVALPPPPPTYCCLEWKDVLVCRFYL